MMYLQMRLYDENFGEKFSSYRRIFAQISIWGRFATGLESMISLEVPALSGTSGQTGHTLDEIFSFKLAILANSKSTFNNSDAPYKTNEIKIISGNI